MDAILKFEVTNQQIKRTDDFLPVHASKDYLKAHFDFLTDEWDGLTRTAIFESHRQAYEVILDFNDDCMVPWEVLTEPGSLYVSVYAGSLITVNTAKVFVARSGYTGDAVNGREPTPTTYEQVIGYLDEVKETAVSAAESATASAEKAAELAALLEHIDGGSFTDWQKEG